MAQWFDTSDATVADTDIKNGETAYARGKKITGVQKWYVKDGVLYVPSDWYVQDGILYIPESWFANGQ